MANEKPHEQCSPRSGATSARRAATHSIVARWPTRWPMSKMTCTIDRKSTRLNSSHANISYAVFCFKKKDKNHTEHNRLHNPKATPHYTAHQYDAHTGLPCFLSLHVCLSYY